MSHPIRFSNVLGNGMDTALSRPGNWRDTLVGWNPNDPGIIRFNLALDDKGNLSGSVLVGHVDFAPKQ
jgi:hypothetical protein